ncbi:MAG: hypothetical protein G01um101438_516 [Parcubacteria group bacterium Gr01-1014_38]|nr:MAG: hypothetical protein G01um101438_516 [Parcubacteria group bacterium Gr01-1014_38]
MPDPSTQRPPHPLLTRELRLIRTWKEWKKLWDEEVHPERLLGLLHFGFNVTEFDAGEWPERVLLYLSIADGHAWEISKPGTQKYEISWSTFGKPTTWSKVRQLIAQKAFKELCQHLFKYTRSHHDEEPSWLQPLTQNSCQLLDAVLAFFLLHDTLEPQLRNLPRDDKSHEYGLTVSFLLSLCDFGWKLRTLREYGADIEVAENLRQRRPQFIRVLAGLKRLDLVTTKSMELDEADCDMLRKIALGTELYLPTEPNWGEKHRLPKTLEEAVAGGSSAARLLLLHKIKLQEKARFAQLRKLAATQEDASLQIERLKTSQTKS